LSLEHMSRRQLWLYGAKQCCGLGFLAGTLEVAALTARLKLPLSLVEFVTLGVTATVAMGLFSGLIGVSVGWVQLVRPERRRSRRLASHVGLAGLLLTGFYLWQGSLALLSEGRAIAAVAMAVMPIGFGGVVFYNAAYWFRKVELGTTYRFGWALVSLTFSAAMIVLVGAVFQARDTGGGWALEGDQNVLLITIDTLRRDHVGLYSEGDSRTPNIDQLGRSGLVFANAVTPVPETAPAHATMLTGLHPLRHQVLSNGAALSRGYQTVPEVLSQEGYATGAFVSSFALDSSAGLDQGFLVYDDDFTPVVPAITRINLIRRLATAWMVAGNPAVTPWLFERRGEDTVDRFEQWLRSHQEVPFLGWVHLFEPHAPYEHERGGIDHRGRMDADWTDAERSQLRLQYGREVERVDALVGRLLSLLEELDLTENTLVILTADHGELLGEHGFDFNHFSLYDEVVRVPLVVRAPGLEVHQQEVAAQVRLMDLPATILEYLEIDAMEETEGVELLGYGTGRRQATMWCALVGRQGRSSRQGRLIGLRNNGIKYIRNLDDGNEQLFDVDADPAEADDLVAGQPDVLESARRLVSSEAKALEIHLSESAALDMGAQKMLEALGYAQ
jgi:arylsulfatase A-like enzyme